MKLTKKLLGWISARTRNNEHFAETIITGLILWTYLLILAHGTASQVSNPQDVSWGCFILAAIITLALVGLQVATKYNFFAWIFAPAMLVTIPLDIIRVLYHGAAHLLDAYKSWNSKVDRTRILREARAFATRGINPDLGLEEHPLEIDRITEDHLLELVSELFQDQLGRSFPYVSDNGTVFEGIEIVRSEIDPEGYTAHCIVRYTCREEMPRKRGGAKHVVHGFMAGISFVRNEVTGFVSPVFHGNIHSQREFGNVAISALWHQMLTEYEGDPLYSLDFNPLVTLRGHASRERVFVRTAEPALEESQDSQGAETPVRE